MTNKFKVGDKVVPINKTKGISLYDSIWADKGKEQGFLYIVGVHSDYYSCWYNMEFGSDNFKESDLIPYEENFVLPEKWAIKITEKNSIIGEYFNKQYSGSCYTEFNYGYFHRFNSCGEDITVGGTLSASFHKKSMIEGYTEITFEQFQKYVLKENKMKKILGYRLTKPEYHNAVKQITGFNFDFVNCKNTSGDTYYAVRGGIHTTVAYDSLKKAGVLDLWFEEVYEDVYEENYKVGDWVIGWYSVKSPVVRLTEKVIYYKGFVTDWKTFDGGAYQNISVENIQRKATEEEIKNHLVKVAESKGFINGVNMCDVVDINGITGFAGTIGNTTWNYYEHSDTLTYYNVTIYEKGKWATIAPKEKVVSVGGKFNVTIKNGKIWHKSDDITSFVREIKSFVDSIPKKLSGYDFIVDSNSITITKSGCQNHNVTIKDWLDVYKQL